MTDMDGVPDGTDSTPEQVLARRRYEALRHKLVALRSAPQPDEVQINAVIEALSHAQMAYKAAHGLIGNNPVDDAQ